MSEPERDQEPFQLGQESGVGAGAIVSDHVKPEDEDINMAEESGLDDADKNGSVHEDNEEGEVKQTDFFADDFGGDEVASGDVDVHSDQHLLELTGKQLGAEDFELDGKDSGDENKGDEIKVDAVSNGESERPGDAAVKSEEALTVGDDLKGDESEDEKVEIEEDREQDLDGVPQLHKIVIPSYASWFELKQVNSVEISSLPEFFNNTSRSKTPLIYLNYRNFMVNTYRLNPNEYLTLTAVRRNLTGDVGSLLRVHRFLNKWGLINYQVDPENKVYSIEPPELKNPKVTYDTPRGLFPFESFVLPEQTEKLEQLKKLVGLTGEANGTNGTNGHESAKRPKIMKGYNSDWTGSELKKLLAALQDNKLDSTVDSRHDWLQISEYVGSKTPEQCIARFLQLPIEDLFLDDSKGLDLGPLKYAPHFPYSKADNPVISSIAFLCGLVDKEVVAAAKDRAIKKVDKIYLKELKDEEAEKLELTESEHTHPQDSKELLEEGAAAALASAASRSHLFASYEERQLNQHVSVLVNRQLSKVDLKLAKLAASEKELELQKKTVNALKEEVLIDRLNLTSYKKSLQLQFHTIHNEFQDILRSFEDENPVVKEKLSKVEQLLAESNKLMQSSSKFVLSDDTKKENESEDQNDSGTEEAEDLKPVSVEAPHLYKFWAG